VGQRIRQTDRIIGCSRHITGLVQKRFPDLAAKCRTVYNGVDTTQFAYAPIAERSGAQGIRTVLFVGRVSPEKGVHLLIDALPEIAARVPDLKVKIVGGQQQLPLDFLVGLSEEDWVANLKVFYPDNNPTAYITILREKLAASGLSDRVQFIKQLPYHEISELMRQADVLVNPSLSDAFPRAPVEAMATGLPVVAARVGGVVESVVDQQTGILVEPDSSEALAAAINRLLTDDDLRERMGLAAREHIVNRFSWPSIAADLEREYQHAVAEHD
jgi:glycosyltransferase involved in cell wall biosynthesis